MGQCIAKIPHTCGTLTGLQVFQKEDDKIDGFCFSCHTFIPYPFGEDKNHVKHIPKKALCKVMSPEEQLAKVEEITEEYGCCDLVQRRLRKDTLEQFGVKIGLSEEDGETPYSINYPYRVDGKLVAYKIKLLANKKIWSVGDQKDVDFFGWQEAIDRGAKRLIITEGEDDAVAGTKILELYTKDDFVDNMPALVSLPHGSASAAADLTRLLPKIKQYGFKDISFCFDMDAAGEKATEACCKVCPQATVIALPKKDLNDCLKEGVGKAA